MKRWRRIRLAIYTLLGLATIYCAVWYIIANRFESHIARWAEERRADGWTVTHGAVTLGGFPFDWRATVDAPALSRENRDQPFRWSGKSIVLVWKPWKPRDIGFEATGTHDLAAGRGPARIVSRLMLERGEGAVRFDSAGDFRRLSLLLDGATLEFGADRTLLANRVLLVVDTPPVAGGARPGKPHLVPSIGLRADIFGLTLPPGMRAPLGRTVGRALLRGTVLGRIPPGRPAAALSEWQQSGGTVELGTVELGWSSLVVRANGTLALDSELQPVAAMTGTVSGHSETLDAFSHAGLIKPGAVIVANLALGALSRTPPGGGRPVVEVPLTVQDGWLFVGPVRLLRLPRIHWR